MPANPESTTQDAPKKRPKAPSKAIATTSLSTQPGLTVEERLVAMADDLSMLRTGLLSLSEDVEKRLEDVDQHVVDLKQAISVTQKGESEVAKRLDAMLEEQRQTTSATRESNQTYRDSMAMVAVVDRMTAKQARAARRAMEKWWAEEQAKPTPKPLPFWLYCLLVVAGPVLLFFACFGAYRFFL